MLVCQLNSQVARRSLKVHVSPSEYNLRTYVSRLTIRALSVLLRLTSHHLLRRGPDSNRRIKVLQTSPLPLGYRAIAISDCQFMIADLLRSTLDIGHW